MKPSVKSEAVEEVISNLLGADRREAIYQNRCQPRPIGCGKELIPELEFPDELSAREYSISGLCADCQASVFGHPVSGYPVNRSAYEPTDSDFVIGRQAMTSGQGEAQSRRYRKHIGKSGKIWLVADQENAADNLYIQGDPGSDGFGGATLKFPLVDSDEVVELKGPWHSNSEHFYSDTSIDIRDKHLTFVVVSRDRKQGKRYESVMVDVLYRDDAPTVGLFKRGDAIAQEWADRLGQQVFLYSQSQGGSSCGPVKPSKQPADVDGDC